MSISSIFRQCICHCVWQAIWNWICFTLGSIFLNLSLKHWIFFKINLKILIIFLKINKIIWTNLFWIILTLFHIRSIIRNFLNAMHIFAIVSFLHYSFCLWILILRKCNFIFFIYGKNTFMIAFFIILINCLILWVLFLKI